MGLFNLLELRKQKHIRVLRLDWSSRETRNSTLSIYSVARFLFEILLNLLIHWIVDLDHGTLEHATSFLMFVRRVRLLNMPESGPLVVHCSAGVGRTGCFIVIDALLERMKFEKTIDIYGHVTLLRAQR